MFTMWHSEKGAGSRAQSFVCVRRGIRACHLLPPGRQPRGKLMVSLVNSHTNATRIGWHLWYIDFRFAHRFPPGWMQDAG